MQQTDRALADRIYLDHAATTPMLPAARAAMMEACARWANPSSPHAEGRAAKAALEQARARIKQAYGWSGALIFTSGASEAIALAMRTARVGTRFAGAVEHDAVLRHVAQEDRIAVDACGRIDMAELARRIQAGAAPALVAIQWANSETGVVQSIDHAADVVRAHGGSLLVDASQRPPPWPAALTDQPDFVILSAHKVGGPPGIGALLVRDLALLEPAGGQEQGYRGGTENVPAAIGFAAAVESWPADWPARTRQLFDFLDRHIREGGGEVLGDAPRSPLIRSYRLPGVSAATQLIKLDLAGFAVSAGSACASGSLRPSHVLSAMGWDETAAREVIRVSIAPSTRRSDIEAFLKAWQAIAATAGQRAA